MMKKTAFFCLIILMAAFSALAAQQRETLTLAAAGCQSLRIECGAGSLKVQGDDKLEQVEVSAVLTVNGIGAGELPGFKKEYVTLTLEKSGDRAVLTASIDSGHWLERLFDHGRDARIDLEVRLPRRLALDIDDGSGDLEIRGCDGGLRLEDGSGDARLADIKGKVRIEDGSGDLRLDAVAGDIEIEDGSGDIELKGAGGDVDISDGSGEIAVFQTLGSVTVDDGSGDIVIDGVEKNVTIDEAGSGEVSIRNVKGQVKK
jgi:hypothetical protein